MVGCSVHGARQARHSHIDEHEAGELATAFLLAAARNTDPAVFPAVDNAASR